MATTDPAVVETALPPTVIAAVEQHGPTPLLADPFARHMLPRSARFLVRLSGWSLVRRASARASEPHESGIWPSGFISDVLAHATAKDVESFGVLAAGLDAVVPRVDLSLRGARVHQVDLPEIVHRKRTPLASMPGPATSHSTLVPVDVHTENLDDFLAARGYRAEVRTAFAWDSVTQYLGEDGVGARVAFPRAALPGSHLVSAYVRQDLPDGGQFYGPENRCHRPGAQKSLWRSGVRPDRVRSYLAGHGTQEVEQLGVEQIGTRS